jgi:signal transduction histidine kinase
MNLWNYLKVVSGRKKAKTHEAIFKSKQPVKRYISVRTSIINNGSQLISVFSDITRLKEIEKEGQRLRSQFFSSVAHELRTPLNSVIPILKVVVSIIQKHRADSNQG